MDYQNQAVVLFLIKSQMQDYQQNNVVQCLKQHETEEYTVFAMINLLTSLQKL